MNLRNKRVLITAAGLDVLSPSWPCIWAAMRPPTPQPVFLRAGQTIHLGIAGLGEQQQVTVQAD